MATRGGAELLDLASVTGSLQVGKRADIITVQRQQPWLQPWHDIYAGLVYSTRGLDVQHVWVDGEQRVAGGQLLAIDVDTVNQHAVDWHRTHTSALQFSR